MSCHLTVCLFVFLPVCDKSRYNTASQNQSTLFRFIPARSSHSEMKFIHNSISTQVILRVTGIFMTTVTSQGLVENVSTLPLTRYALFGSAVLFKLILAVVFIS